MSHRSSVTGLPAWKESLSRVDRHRRLNLHVNCRIPVFDYVVSHETCCCCVQHHVTWSISCWQWIRKLFTVWLLFKVFVLPILHLPLRLGAHWQLSSCGDKNSCCDRARTATKQLLVRATFFFQYRMDFTETACICALLLRIRKDRRKKRHWVHPAVSKRLLNGQFYKLYEDLRYCRGKVFSYFRMGVESFDKLLALVGPRIMYENTGLRLSVPPQERLAVTLR